MTGLELPALIIGGVTSSIALFIKMLSDRNAVLRCPCCELDLRSKEVRLQEINVRYQKENQRTTI